MRTSYPGLDQQSSQASGPAAGALPDRQAIGTHPLGWTARFAEGLLLKGRKAPESRFFSDPMPSNFTLFPLRPKLISEGNA